MEKKRKMHFALILTVIALTLYNILPTLFFYTKPLGSPISKETAERIAADIAERVDHIEGDSLEWLQSYCTLLNIHPQSIATLSDSPDVIRLQFAKSEEAQTLRKLLPRAGFLIPFMPAQLSVASASDNAKEVLVQRRIGLRLTPLLKDKTLFQYIPKYEGSELSSSYRSFIQERLSAVVQSLSSPAEIEPNDPFSALASSILEIATLYPNRPEFAQRLATRMGKTVDLKQLMAHFTNARDALKKEKSSLETSSEKYRSIESRELKFAAAEAFLKKHPGLFAAEPLIGSFERDRFDLSKSNPFFHELSIDWEKNRAILHLQPDVASLLAQGTAEEKQLAEQLLIDEAAKIARTTHEEITPSPEGYVIALQQTPELSGLLALNLDKIAHQQATSILRAIRAEWQPSHPDLRDLPIVTTAEYEGLSLPQKSLCLVIQTPIAEANISGELQADSLYVVAKGIGHILRSYEGAAQSPEAVGFFKDFQALAELLFRHGFVGFANPRGSEDYIFEHKHFFAPLLAATREEFKVFGTKRSAFLELSTVEQRILTTNKIETRIHEDLLKWSDEYRASQVNLHSIARFDVPKPTRSIFWNNLKLTMRKLWRGDERKILRWGLDLSGGKSVQIELRDQNNQVVKDEADLKQGINELFNRVNKMGVSDVSIRRIGHHICLDFPGSQALSATELVKASSMFFHVVNEKFGPSNPALAAATDRFLQEVWNEATVLRRQDPESIEWIAYRHLYSEAPSEAAKTLLENGLSLADPHTASAGKELDETLSKVALIREMGPSRQTHPLLIVFHNYALEGSNLDNIRSNYDPSKGNFLSFDVRGNAARSALFSWTSLFSKERVLGTNREAYAPGRGWRMAVLLNGSVISSPTLESPLQSNASISGSFTQREIQQLVSDLKAGSLTFAPKILSEKNISPQLGKSDRAKGIAATIGALILVIASMIVYYRFAGLIASIAVLFNLLILWAVLQNLGASLSLAGIAGVILTVGMAVDANVLVFERMKEELAHSGRIASAIRAGYEKAFSAIVDSNVTTIIAALILLNFDAGPIKAFAVAMIIGIASSMFTALYMTKFYFTEWLRNPRHTNLSMSNWIRASHFDFLKRARHAFLTAGIIIVAGGALLIANRSTLFGMDFTGGYALSLELEASSAHNAAQRLEQALLAKGASAQDFQIRQHSPANHLQVLLGTGMEILGKPFHGLPLETNNGSTTYAYQKNPRIDWVVQAIESAGLSLSASAKQTLDANWTAMSGQMSESMRNNAMFGLLLAFAGIFIYISLRFEYKYAIAALLCLFHDVLITLGCIGLLHACKVPVQIDLNTIAALMTIIGYSLNDTIIVFDRIREDLRLYRHKPMREIVNHALNTTLSRTTITSGTTLLVLLALLTLGGASIFSFALVMVIGVVFGTISSWFIAAPLMLLFHDREEKAVERDVVVNG